MAVLRDFLPGANLASETAVAGEDVKTVDDLLREAGYRLRLIDSQTPVPGIEPEDHRTVVTFPIWLRLDGGVYVAELYNHPIVYGAGETEKEAVDDILMLMYGFYLDYRLRGKSTANPDENFSVDLGRLRDYLVKVFG
jgi:hypothetical protein